MLDKGAGREVKVRAQAERYVSRLLRDIRQVGKLSRYQYTEEEINQIFTAIRNELDTVQTMFAPPQPKPAQPEFKFNDL
jgi:hypothetical protein